MLLLSVSQVLGQSIYKPQRGTTPLGGTVSLSNLPQSTKNSVLGTITNYPFHIGTPYSPSVEKYQKEQAASDTLKVTEDRDGSLPNSSTSQTSSGTVSGKPQSSTTSSNTTQSVNFQGIQQTLYTPPDPVIAAGPNYVIEAVNHSFAIYNKSGTQEKLYNFLNFFSSFVTSSDIITDPKVIYDQYADRYVMLILDLNSTNHKGNYLIAVSQTSDPTTGLWYKYSSDATLDGSTSTSNTPDYPGLGYDSQAVYVTSNQYASYGTGPFQYAKIRIFNKSQLYNGQTLTYADFTKMQDNYGYAFTIKPAQQFGSVSTAYFLNTEEYGASSVTLWRINNPLTTPTILHTTINVASYSSNSPYNTAPQHGSSVQIYGNDSRTQDVVYRNGYLYSAFADLYNWGSGTVVAIRFLKIDVSSNTAVIDAEYGGGSSYYIYPHIFVDAYGEMAMDFSRSSSTEYPSVLYTYSRPQDPSTMTSSFTLEAGTGPYTFIPPGYNNPRWGDYSGIALDPTQGNQVWFAGEYATSNNTWGTEIGSYSIPIMIVTISGPTQVAPGSYPIWTANVSGGTSPYQYNWQINEDLSSGGWTGWSYFGNQQSEGMTYSSSIYEVELQVTVTDADNNTANSGIYIVYFDQTSTPVTSLSDPTPNPFNPTTILNYSLAKPSHVKLLIYNILGQKVATLVNRDQVAGKYRKTFDASQLASGTYLERMLITDIKSGKVTQLTKKLLLMK